MTDTLRNQYLEINIFHAVEYLWPQRKTPHVAWPRQYALWLIEEGELQVQIGQEEWLLRAGSVFLAPMRQPRQLSAPSTCGAHWWSLNFLPSWFSKIDPLQSLQQPLYLHHPEGMDELQDYMRLMAHRWMAHWHGGPLTPQNMEEYHNALPMLRASLSREQQLICQGLAHAIFGWCLETLERNHIPLHLHQSVPSWLVNALTVIEEDSSITVTDLAQQMAFSPAQLRRLFHQWIGVSPQEYLVERRMDRARYLLANTNWTVATIAGSLGFSSLSSFARIFKQVYGIPPLQLRHSLHRSSTET